MNRSIPVTVLHCYELLFCTGDDAYLVNGIARIFTAESRAKNSVSSNAIDLLSSI